MNENAKQIMDAAFHIHTALGPGLLESVYQAVLAYELSPWPPHREPTTDPGGLPNHSNRHRLQADLT